MEQVVFCSVLDDGGLKIPQSIICSIGSELQCVSINNAVILIAKAGDSRFPGELLPFDGTVYRLPEQLMSELRISRGDNLKMIYSDNLGFIVVMNEE